MSEQKGRDALIFESSGDVFADLGLHLDAKDRLKNAIAQEITKLIISRSLTQMDVAEILCTDQAKVSNITRGRLSGFSVDRLFNFLTLLGYDIDIHLTESENHPGNVNLHSQMVAVG